MRVPSSGLRLDSPSFPLLQAHISYWGITSAAGNALGTTLVCADLANEPNYAGLLIKVMDGGAAGQPRPIASDIAGTIAVAAAFTNAAGAVQQIAAGTRFVILSILGGGGAPPPAPPAPGVGLWMFGVCDPGMAASLNTLVLTNLAGFNDDIFNNEFWIQVIHNADVPGTAPERQIRRVTDYVGASGTFTVDPFLNNVEANDLVAVFHESILSVEILGYGTLTLSSATVPEDNLRLEVDNYFNGNLFMATEGVCRFQPRRIVDWAVGGAGPGSGIFTLDPNNPLTGLPGTVDYIIIGDQTEFVPAADGANNRTPSDVTGSKTSTPIFVADNVSDQMRYLKGLLANINAGLEPSESLIETWQDLLIDPNIWTVTNPATGAAWAPAVAGAFIECLTTPAASENARLIGDHLWQLHSITPNLNLIVKKTIMEWTMSIGVLGNIDNAHTFFGWIPGVGNTRNDDNIIGFCLLADVLCTLTDLGSGETVNTTFLEDLTLVHKFRIEVYEANVDFYLDEARIAQHTTNIPNVPSYPNFYIQTDAGGPCALPIGIVKVWYEMVERY